MKRIACGFGLLLAMHVARADDPLVLVERVVDTRYGRTEKADIDFVRALESRVLSVHDVKENESLQSITRKVYSIAPEIDKDRYEALEAKITQINGLRSPNSIASGSRILLPDIPPRQQNVTAPEQDAKVQPQLSRGPSPTAVESGAAFDFNRSAFDLPLSVSTGEKSKSPFVRQARWIPASIVRGDKSLRVISQPLSIKFETGSGDGDSLDISKDLQDIGNVAAQAAQSHESVLVILDDSWPDAQEFRNTLAFIRQADDRIRNAFHLGKAAAWPVSISTANTTDPPKVAQGAASHSQRIKAALAPFTAMNTRVKVIYLPLFMQQQWSTEITSEMILVSRMAAGKGSALEQSIDMTDITADAQDTTSQIVARLPKIMTTQPSGTDQAIITSALQFMQLYAMATGAPYFFNASWVIDKYEIAVELDPQERLGVILAAAGNDDGVDLFKTPVLLASRAREFPGDVIAVGNAHPDGQRAGCSSFWRPPEGTPMYALVYTGFIGQGQCGSSYSTPRIAWVLAFRQSILPLVQGAAQQQWFAQYRRFVLRMQNTQAQNELRYWFSPAHALQDRP